MSKCHSPARLLAIGDIHGCLRPLGALLERVAPTADDQLIFLGDYIDRGPDSAGVIDELLAVRRRWPRSVFLRGNHEQMLLDVLAGGRPFRFLLNGGDRTIASYQARHHWPPPVEHLVFLANLPAIFTTAGFIFAHAGLRPGLPIAAQHPDDLLWIRGEFLDSAYDWGSPVVFGHTPCAEPLLTAKRIGLDTGCVFGGQLTCCDLLTRTCWQSKC